METLTIQVPDNKVTLVKQLLKELDVRVTPTVSKATHKKAASIPNSKTTSSIEDARKGKTKRIANFKTFFDSI